MTEVCNTATGRRETLHVIDRCSVISLLRVDSAVTMQFAE